MIFCVRGRCPGPLDECGSFEIGCKNTSFLQTDKILFHISTILIYIHLNIRIFSYICIIKQNKQNHGNTKLQTSYTRHKQPSHCRCLRWSWQILRHRPRSGTHPLRCDIPLLRRRNYYLPYNVAHNARRKPTELISQHCVYGKNNPTAQSICLIATIKTTYIYFFL